MSRRLIGKVKVMSNKLRSFLIVVISIAVVMAALPMNAFRVNAATFYLTYNGNGGKEENGSSTYLHGSDDQGKFTILDNVLPKTQDAPGFINEGYVFKGWADSEGATYTVGGTYTPGGDLTIYAQWAKACVITFDSNYPVGATGSSITMDKQQVEIGTSANLNENLFTCRGYRFDGWKDDAENTYADRANFTANSDNVTLHAQWKPIYLITYNPNNKTTNVYEDSLDKDSATPHQVRSNVFWNITFPGYSFLCWNTKQDGTGDKYNVSDLLTPTSDVTLYAQWTRTITFRDNLTSGATDAQDITVGSPTNLTANGFAYTDDSKSFVGWTTVANPTDKTIEYTDGASVTLTGDDATDITTLYAQWGIPCTVHFNANYPTGATGTSGSMNDLVVGKGFTTPINNGFLYTGHTFTGWNTDPNGNGEAYDATSISLDENLAENEITLYAQWEINKYTITFMSDGTEISADTYNHGQTPVAPSPEPTKAPTNTEVYSFEGWADSTGTLLDSLPAATGNATYYARFTSSTRHYTVSATANPSAGGTVSGSGSSYEWNSTATVVASPSTGYHFVKWTDNGADAGTATTYSITIDGNHTVVAEFERNSYTVTLEASAGGQATIDKTTCLYMDQVTVAAAPDTGYTFVNWVQDGQVVSSDPTYTFTVTADSIVKPVFSINSYTISLSSDGNGSVEGAGDYNFSSTATVTASPNTGYYFVNWTDENGNEVNTSATYSFTVDGARSLKANFALKSYNIDVEADDHGSVTGKGIYYYGESITIKAMPETGYHFVNWTIDGNVVSTNANYTFTVTGPTELTANFAIDSYTVDATAGGNGSVSGSGTYDYSETCTLVAIPEKGYHFVGWEENGTTVSENANYRFSVTGNRKIKAVFEINMYTVTYKNDDGTILQEGEFPWGSTASYQHMANPTKKPTVQFTYTFAGWDNKDTLVTKDLTFTAVYTSTVNKYKITFANEDGTVLQTSEVEYGKFPVYDKSAPTKSATVEETFTFAGWDKEIATVTGDTVYTATYTSKPITKDSINYKYFTVAFVSNGGSEVVSQLVAEGGVAFKPEEPLRERYSFGGWYIDEALTKPFSFATAITSDITLYAKWVKGAPEAGATYAVVGMGSTTVDISSGEDITIAVERSKDNDSIAKHFVGVQIDGVDVDYYNYELSDDNSSVIISADALNGLDEGTHTITIVYDDGTAEVELIVADSNEPVKTTEEIIEPEPVTGNEEPVNVTAETNNAGLWIALAIVAGVVVAAIPIFIVKIRSLK